MSQAAKMPERIARLPRDKRGYPIPWNVLRGVEGAPFFTVNDDRKHWKAAGLGLCPLCGERLGKWKWFIGGPRSAFDEHGWYLDLPAHHECGRFALATCPYLAAPLYVGRIDIANPEQLPPEARIFINETMVPERPALFVAVASDVAEFQDNGPQMLPYVRPARPALAYEYWRHGQEITLAEAMPFLRTALGEVWSHPGVAE